MHYTYRYVKQDGMRLELKEFKFTKQNRHCQLEYDRTDANLCYSKACLSEEDWDNGIKVSFHKSEINIY